MGTGDLESGQDAWRPVASLSILRTRAELLAGIRRFFHRLDVLEVETPALSRAGTPAPYLESFTTRDRGTQGAGDRTLYLHTSPEFPMKRLLAAGSGSIYQVCKVFRCGELGQLHNPEFTLLEWYRTGYDEYALMDEIEQLLATVVPAQKMPDAFGRMTYRQLFTEYAGVDGLTASARDLRACCKEHGVPFSDALLDLDLDGWRDLVLTEIIVPALGDRVMFVHDYPATQAALACVSDDDPPVARRFELLWHGVELANGFLELADGMEQSRRFAVEQQQRRKLNLPEVELDTRLIAALEGGLPDCAGVALGIDRLLMVITGQSDLRRVLAFPIDIA